MAEQIMVGSINQALIRNEKYKDKLKRIDISPVLESDNVREVKMVVHVRAGDPIDIYSRLTEILDVCIGDDK